MSTDSFSSAAGMAIAANRAGQPQVWVKEFLGDNWVLLDRVNTRFNYSRVWRIKHKKTDELFYCKILNFGANDAESLGLLLTALARRNLPVPFWIKLNGQHCIPLNHSRCVVLEQALPGVPLPHPYPDDGIVQQCAATLAKLHLGLAAVGPAPGTFRPDFSEGLDSMGRIMDALWDLLVYSHYQAGASRCSTATQFQKWIEQYGKSVYLRLKHVKNQLLRQLDDCGQQWILGDFNYSNIFNSNGVISGVTDFEDVHLGPRELDVLSFCMYGIRELHFPEHLDVFVPTYCDHHPSGLNHSALGTIARAIANIRLARKICSIASYAHLGSQKAWIEGEKTINYLNELCDRLSEFEFHCR